MKRTINEKRSLGIVSYSLIVGLFGLGCISFGLNNQGIIIYSIGISSYVASLFIIFFGGYGLGWEYKRLSLEETEE